MTKFLSVVLVFLVSLLALTSCKTTQPESSNSSGPTITGSSNSIRNSSFSKTRLEVLVIDINGTPIIAARANQIHLLKSGPNALTLTALLTSPNGLGGKFQQSASAQISLLANRTSAYSAHASFDNDSPNFWIEEIQTGKVVSEASIEKVSQLQAHDNDRKAIKQATPPEAEEEEE